jgi:uncharacterized surface protein with fasciclin (FAS1) repeats
MKKFYPIMLVMVFALLLAACGGTTSSGENANADVVVEDTTDNTGDQDEKDSMDKEEMEGTMLSIAEIASGDENFSTLVTALDAAGLVETMAGEGAFTVFAPTNDAFSALGDTLNDVIADTDLLTKVLLYHVVDGKVMSPDAIALAGSEVETLSGDKIALSLQGESLYINDAMVTAVDIEASNGVIHVIDAVLLPPADDMDDEMGEMGTIVDIAVADERFSTLVTAVTQAGLAETLAGEGAFTVFAPTNDAFAALGSDLDAVLADNDLLTKVLLYHVLDGKVMSETAVTLDGQEVETLSSDKFAISLRDGNLYINESMVVIADIEASNGVIHVIDAVLLPPQ